MSEAIAYYDPQRLIAEVFEAAFLPPRRASVADWAKENRYLSNDGGGYVGLWRHENAPYLREPMQCLAPPYLTVAIVGPGQCGKTEVATNWLAASIAGNPADFLWYVQTEAAAQSFVKTRIDKLIDTHQDLRKRIGHRPTDDTLKFKRFEGMQVEFLVATSSSLISRSVGRIVADEIDAYDPSLGDVKALLDIRRQTFGRESMLCMISHPDRAGGLAASRWDKGIMAVYADSDRRIGWWQCPECGVWSSPNPTASRVMTLDYPVDAPLDEVAEAAHLICPVNGCLLNEEHRRRMIRTLRWVGLGETITEDGEIHGERVKRDTAGFWITGLMSPFVLGGMGALARAKVKATREWMSSGDDASLREVTTKQWGIPYDAPRVLGSLDATALADRAEPDLALGAVPEGVRYLTAAFDVQANRFEFLVRGWGVDSESWVVDWRWVPASPANNPDDWDKMLGTLLDGGWPLADGSGRVMRLRAVGFDSGGEPGVTAQAYAAWSRWRSRRRVIRYGRISGRDAWSVIPLKGSGKPNAAVLSVVYPDTSRKDRKVKTSGEVPIATFNANRFKDDLVGQLGKADAGHSAVHFPAALCSEEPPHVWFEQLVAETRRPDGRWVNESRARNEAMDLMVMTHVVQRLHTPHRIDWTKPPAWAGPWASNPLVTEGPKIAPTAPATATAPVMPVPMPVTAIRSRVRSRGISYGG